MKTINQLYKERYRLFTFSLILYCFFCSSFSEINAQNSTENDKIEGTIELDSIWNNKIYLSHISDFRKMYTMSRSMIIAESDVDSSGHFKFKTNFLPKEDNLYRIHVSKKGSSEASIIIGGKDENHFFIVANKASNIKILNENRVFNDVTFLSDNKNQIISKIDGIVKLIDSTIFNATRIKNEFVANAFNEQLRQIADTCSYSLVSLYALQKSKFETDIKNNTEFYQNYSEKWNNEKSTYFKNFRTKVPKRKNTFDNRILVFFGILSSFALGFFLSNKIKNRTYKTSKLLKSLSVQERKIYILLKQGKSNKEISDEFNIGVSTVKSHVSSIYNKLNIKSRREIVNLNNEQ